MKHQKKRVKNLATLQVVFSESVSKRHLRHIFIQLKFSLILHSIYCKNLSSEQDGCSVANHSEFCMTVQTTDLSF